MPMVGVRYATNDIFLLSNFFVNLDTLFVSFLLALWCLIDEKKSNGIIDIFLMYQWP
jgi:hypothetical protein